VRPQLKPEGLTRTRPWEYLARFVFGGMVTACTGLVAHHFGPSIGGLFLAFPAILPASLTLVKRHDGRAQAVDDARGACLGSIALAAFAFIVQGTATRWPAALVLGSATLVWAVVGGALWGVRYGQR
jgi:hypothetical protein